MLIGDSAIRFWLIRERDSSVGERQMETRSRLVSALCLPKMKIGKRQV
jgi:hypothetical protein